METITQIYIDFLSNIFTLLFLFKFFTHNTGKKIKNSSVIFFTLIYFIYSIFSTGTNNMAYIMLFDLLFVCIHFYPELKKALIFYIKFEFIYFFSYIVIFLVHSALIGDFFTVVDSSGYTYYKSIICGSMIYIIYILHINNLKILSFNKLNRNYRYYFNGMMIVTLFLLSYSTLYICKNDINNSTILPILFSAIYILIAVYLSIYDKVITLLEENALSKIQAEKSRLEQQYSYQLEDNLKQLHAIRHDIKNHLIIIDGYSIKGECDRIHAYIERILEDFSSTYLIDTPSDTISSLLNAKYQECLRKNINFKINYDFNKIYIEDYYIITILGNLLDNSITAASKLAKESGYITLSIFQVSSYLEINIENNHIEQIKTAGKNFISTKKEENAFHGIGIKNVRMAIDALNGQLDIHYTDSTFFVSVMIPNY